MKKSPVKTRSKPNRTSRRIVDSPAWNEIDIFELILAERALTDEIRTNGLLRIVKSK